MGGGNELINWEEIRKEFEETEITMKLLAEKHDIKATTLRSRKNREKWKKQNETKSVATKNATQHKNVATQKAVETIQEDSELTEKQKLFCLYFSQFNNATKAYQKAYECDYESAMANGSRLMRNDKVRAEIKYIKAARTDDWLIDDRDIVNEWMKMAFSDITDYVEFGIEEVEESKEKDTGKEDEDGFPIFATETETYKYSFVNLKESNEVDGTIIHEVKKGKDGVSVKLYDKQRALIELNKLIGGENVMRLQKMQAELDMAKAQLFRVKAENGDFDDEVLEDDGFMNAIKGMVTNKEVWPDED